MTLPSDPARWPEEWRVELRERQNICEFDGMLEPADALQVAIRDVRRLAEGGQVDLFRGAK